MKLTFTVYVRFNKNGHSGGMEMGAEREVKTMCRSESSFIKENVFCTYTRTHHGKPTVSPQTAGLLLYL